MLVFQYERLPRREKAPRSDEIIKHHVFASITEKQNIFCLEGSSAAEKQSHK